MASPLSTKRGHPRFKLFDFTEPAVSILDAGAQRLQCMARLGDVVSGAGHAGTAGLRALKVERLHHPLGLTSLPRPEDDGGPRAVREPSIPPASRPTVGGQRRATIVRQSLLEQNIMTRDLLRLKHWTAAIAAPFEFVAFSGAQPTGNPKGTLPAPETSAPKPSATGGQTRRHRRCRPAADCLRGRPPAVPPPGGVAPCIRARVCASVPTSCPRAMRLERGRHARTRGPQRPGPCLHQSEGAIRVIGP
jgi:hypothetical protein